MMKKKSKLHSVYIFYLMRFTNPIVIGNKIIKLIWTGVRDITGTIKQSPIPTNALLLNFKTFQMEKQQKNQEICHKS